MSSNQKIAREQDMHVISTKKKKKVLLQIIEVMYLCSSTGIFVVITLESDCSETAFQGQAPPCLSVLSVHPGRPPCLLCSLPARPFCFTRGSSNISVHLQPWVMQIQCSVPTAHRSIAENRLIMLSAAPSESSSSPIQYTAVDFFVFWCHYRFCSLYSLLRTADKTWVQEARGGDTWRDSLMNSTPSSC